MCRKLALAATALALLAAPLAHAQQAPAAAQASAQAPAKPVKAPPEQRAVADRSDPLTRAAFWNAQVQADPKDFEAGIKLAGALRALDRNTEAAETAQRIVLLDPKNLEARLELGRARIAEGQAFYGIEALRGAQELAPRDWRPVSLLGVAYEQVSRPDDALAAYEAALRLSPDNPAVLSNIAMFHAAKGDALQAEGLLRRAVAHDGATVQMRQNLAFVLGVQGKFAEAERLLREILPPEIASNNLAYLRAMAGTSEPAALPRERSYQGLRTGG